MLSETTAGATRGEEELQRETVELNSGTDLALPSARYLRRAEFVGRAICPPVTEKGTGTHRILLRQDGSAKRYTGSRSRGYGGPDGGASQSLFSSLSAPSITSFAPHHLRNLRAVASTPDLRIAHHLIPPG
jgi:hypothetical protein